MSRPPERSTTMKLPTTNLQSLKLQNAGDFKRLLSRLSPGKLSASAKSKSTESKSIKDKSTQTDGSNLKTANPLATAKSSKGFRIAMHLLLVKPWVLVLGFWLLSLAGGSLALSGMLSPRRLTMALPEPTVTETTQSNPLIKIEQGSDDISDSPSGEAETPVSETVVIGSDAASTTAKQTGNSAALTVLPVALFVGSCAAGCLVMSRRRAMARMAAARSRARARKSKLRTSTAASEAIGSATRVAQSTAQAKRQPKRKVAIARTTRQEANRKGPKVKPRLNKSAAVAAAAQKSTQPSSQPKRRRQRVRPQAAPATANGSRVLASRATAQQPPTPQPRGSKRRSQRASARTAGRRRMAGSRQVASRQPVVSVVPAGEANALDWTNGSLAHQMDVRQHRAM